MKTKINPLKARFAQSILSVTFVLMTLASHAQPTSFNTNVSNSVTQKTQALSETVLSVMNIIGWAVAIGGLIWLGISYITQSQNLRKQVVMTIIGIFIIGARAALLAYISSI